MPLCTGSLCFLVSRRVRTSNHIMRQGDGIRKVGGGCGSRGAWCGSREAPRTRPKRTPAEVESTVGWRRCQAVVVLDSFGDRA